MLYTHLTIKSHGNSFILRLLCSEVYFIDPCERRSWYSRVVRFQSLITARNDCHELVLLTWRCQRSENKDKRYWRSKTANETNFALQKYIVVGSHWNLPLGMRPVPWQVGHRSDCPSQLILPYSGNLESLLVSPNLFWVIMVFSEWCVFRMMSTSKDLHHEQ